MEELSTIQSASNPALKRVRAVGAGKAPEVLLLEGDRLIAEAERLGLEFELLMFAATREQDAARAEARGLPVRRVDAQLLARSPNPWMTLIAVPV